MLTPHLCQQTTVALLTLLLGNTYHARNIVASVLVMIWATRTAGMLLTTVLPVGLVTFYLNTNGPASVFTTTRVSAVPRAQSRQ
jgi:hypothetical protein